ncbi:hypothetical protein F2Q69_00000104 [Brassica cretica]|uniref:RRM domain-containing protein n=1 Tax=Brassica cretica TaxID=69181 RepID=A0A8S9PB89_BRACR|nr:hypothetical protein F2Q69_00000104 [Brassica cretica]
MHSILCSRFLLFNLHDETRSTVLRSDVSLSVCDGCLSLVSIKRCLVMKIVTEARDSTLATCLLERGLVMWNVSLANMEGFLGYLPDFGGLYGERERGSVSLDFSDPRDADDARYRLDGRDVDGSRIVVEFAKGARTPEPAARSRSPEPTVVNSPPLKDRNHSLSPNEKSPIPEKNGQSPKDQENGNGTNGQDHSPRDEPSP